MNVSRAAFLGSIGAFALLPAPARAGSQDEVRLRLRRDGESINPRLLVWDGTQWARDDAGYAQVDWLLRDESAGVVVPMSDALIRLLWDTQRRMSGLEIGITDGFRTPVTNAAMRRRGEGAAKNSRHMHRDAVDCYVDGLSMERLFAVAATSQYCGGLGLYGDHVHVDARACAPRDVDACTW